MRGRYRVRAVVAACVLLLAPGPARAGERDSSSWKFSGRAGIEVDGLGESFGSGTLFDSRFAPSTSVGDAGTLDEALLSLRFRDQDTRASALLDLRLDRGGAVPLRVRSVVRSGPTRTRGELEAVGSARTSLGAFSLGNRLFYQGGPEGGGAGLDDLVNASWTRPGLPAGLELQLAASGERSWGGEERQSRLFDYRVLRQSARLRRTFGWDGEVSVRGGLGRKWTGPDLPGSWRERWAEGEWTRLTLSSRFDLRVRGEARRYARSDTLTPSYDEWSAEGNVEVPIPWRLRASFSPSARRVLYDGRDESIFHDSWTAEGVFRIEAPLHALRGVAEEDAPNGPWTIALGGRGGLLRNDDDPDSDYRTLSALIGVSRGAGAGLWLDWTGEAGRRSYRVSGGSRGLVFEGLDLSISGTDYRFVSTSLLAEVPLGRAFRAEIFGLWEDEAHSAAADDFSLWSFSASLTRSF